MERITFLIVDDHALFREGLRSVLERHDDFTIVGEAGDAETGIRLAAELRPAIVLMDLHLPGRSGVEAIEEIARRHPETGVIVLSMYQEAELVERAILAGARGYLLKDQRAAALIDGIRAVAAGGIAVDPQIGLRLFDEYRRLLSQTGRVPSGDHLLSSREVTVLEHLADGLSNRQIAEKLFLSEQTVKNLLTGIYQKLGVQNRTEAVLQAVQRGIVKR